MRHTILDQLGQDHSNISRVLSLIGTQTDYLASNDEPGQTLLRNGLKYLHLYPGLLHHPVEELIFDRMVQADPSMAGLVAKLKEEHVNGRRTEDELLACFTRQRKPGEDIRPALTDLMRRYLLSYREHMYAESAEVLSLAGGLLQEAQWREIEEQSPFKTDPIFYAQSLVRFSNLYDALMNAGEALKH